MSEQYREFLDWLTVANGAVPVLLAFLGYIFREKWKQILQRDVASNLEHLKFDLTKQNAEQIEKIKYEFQRDLESYKVSLIAEAEAVKAKGDLRKSIALKFSEIEFERLVALEKVYSPLSATILGMAVANDGAGIDRIQEALAMLQRAAFVASEAQMFLSVADFVEITDFRSNLIHIANGHIGPGRPALSQNSGNVQAINLMAVSIHNKLSERIRALGVI